MKPTGIVIDREYLKHVPAAGHPERPERIQVLLDLAAGLDRRGYSLLAPRAAGREDIERVHEPDHVRLIESTSKLNSRSG